MGRKRSGSSRSPKMGSIEDVVADNRMSTESLPFRIVSETDGRDNDLSGPLVPPSSSIKGTEEDVSSDSDSEYAGPSRPSSSFASSSMSASENQEASLSSTDIGPEQKRRKMRDLEFEHLYVDALPCAEMYERSYMHRDAITKIVFTKNQFLITASSDGFVQFWRKMPEGIEFVKKYRAHLGPVVSMSVSSDSSFLCTASTDKAIKVFDVLTFDMIHMIQLPYVPVLVEIISQKDEAISRVAVTSESDSTIRIYDLFTTEPEPIHELRIHRSEITCIKFNAAYMCVISTDRKGMIEYWDSRDFSFPSDRVSFSFKVETNLYALAEAKSFVGSLELSHDGKQFSCMSKHRHVYVFNFETGKIRREFDESLRRFEELQKSDSALFKLDSIDFGRRMAREREIDSASVQPLPISNVLFDESGHFILYGTLLGVKIVNLETNRLVRILGLVESSERFLHVGLFQGVGKPMVGSAVQKKKERDPTIFATSYKSRRFFMFTRREPDDSGTRDIIHEKPTKDEIQSSAVAPQKRLARGAVIHTTSGDIHIKLFSEQCPRTVENFMVHSRNGYYNDTIIHRVIRGFMVQMGDPKGDGTGGTSIWGHDFEDEFDRDLRHDRPFTVSMANAGPNTNGSQFFITTVPCPWLDNKHTVFGRVVKGSDTVSDIEKAKTDKFDKPLEDVKIINIEVIF